MRSRELKRKGESWIDRDLDLDRLNSRDIIRGELPFLVDFFFFFISCYFSRECDVSAHLLSQGLKIFFFLVEIDTFCPF